MKKVVFKDVDICSECPYFRFQSQSIEDDMEDWYECGYTDRILINGMYATGLVHTKTHEEIFKIPSWCPLEDYDIFHNALKIVLEKD